MEGQIARLKRDRGFGFITANEGNDIFFHRSTVADDGFDQLREGQAVVFEAEDSPRGPRATSVRPA